LTTRPLDRIFVQEFSAIYDQTELSTTELALFGEISPKLQVRGEYDYDEFLAVCDWKSTRTRPLVQSNSRGMVSEVTRIAFSCSEDLRVPVLSLLRGVSTPTASALLTVWKPTSYTIIDVRVLRALPHLSHRLLAQESKPDWEGSYPRYLGLMRAISHDLECDLRSLDKALWTFDKTRSELQRTD
jgi:hypothetical protein